MKIFSLSLFFTFFVSYSFCQSKDTIVIPCASMELDSLELIILKNDSLKQGIIDQFFCCGYNNKMTNSINKLLSEQKINQINFASRNVLILVLLDNYGQVVDIQFPPAKGDFLDELTSIKKIIISALNMRTDFDFSFLNTEMNLVKINRFIFKLKFDASGNVINLETF